MALGVDPNPRMRKALGPRQRVFAQTSDEFFEQCDVISELGGKTLDLAFIDGMHQFEFALRDFINVEKHCSPDSIILIHDVYPMDVMSAARERASWFWSGDIWRLILILNKYRPDLTVNVIGARPTGLAIVQNLDPHSRVLAERQHEIIDEFLALDISVLDDGKTRCSTAFRTTGRPSPGSSTRADVLEPNNHSRAFCEGQRSSATTAHAATTTIYPECKRGCFPRR